MDDFYDEGPAYAAEGSDDYAEDDYREGGSDEDDYHEGGSEDEQSDGERSEGEEGISLEATFADRARTMGAGGKPAGFERAYVISRTAEDAALDQAKGILADVYPDTDASKIVEILRGYPNVALMNVPVAVATAVWKTRKTVLSRKTLSTAAKNAGIGAADLLRYIRIVDSEN